MNGWILLAWVVWFVATTWFGTYMGQKWNSLPYMKPYEVVRFRGPQVGMEYKLNVTEVSHSPEGTRVILEARRPTHLPGEVKGRRKR